MSKNFSVDRLQVRVCASRQQLGAAAAKDIAEGIGDVLARKEDCNIIFAAAPSQNETLAALAADGTIDWTRVRAFHMDEYIGLAPGAPQSFASFLRRSLFDKVPLGEVNLIDSGADPRGECGRYAALLRAHPADIVVMGIGENGHIAFNDPHEADFHDPRTVKPVELDEICRRQQVHDGCFSRLEEVPRSALTLTIPALMAPPLACCIVPGTAKAEAVRRTLCEPIGESCPASILRAHPHATLYLDADSAALLQGDRRARPVSEKKQREQNAGRG